MAQVLEDPKAWDGVSDGYNNTITATFRRFNEELVAPFPQVRRCLDLCCGAGAATLPLARKFDRVDAVDFSEGMLRQLGNNVRAEKVSNIYPQQGDALRIDEMFAKETFDIVWSSFGVFMIPAYQNIFRLIWKLLKPGGTFLFTGFPRYQETPFHKALLEACHAAMEKFPLPDYAEDGLHNPNFVENTLAATGFEGSCAEMRTIPFEISNVDSFWSDLENANIQFRPLRNSLGEEGWASFSKRAKQHLTTNYTFPRSLNMVAIVGCGKKP